MDGRKPCVIRARWPPDPQRRADRPCCPDHDGLNQVSLAVCPRRPFALRTGHGGGRQRRRQPRLPSDHPQRARRVPGRRHPRVPGRRHRRARDRHRPRVPGMRHGCRGQREDGSAARTDGPAADGRAAGSSPRRLRRSAPAVSRPSRRPAGSHCPAGSRPSSHELRCHARQADRASLPPPGFRSDGTIIAPTSRNLDQT